MALLDDVKLSLRLTTSAYDTEVNDLISAAKNELELAGILISESTTDPLIKRAINVYCKAHFGFDNSDHDRLVRAFEMLKNHLSLSGDYAFYTIKVTVMDADDDEIQGAEVVVRSIDALTSDLYYTNTSGQASIKLRRGDNYMLIVTADGYLAYEGGYFDMSADTAIEVVLDV
jgi:hypothetical protein